MQVTFHCNCHQPFGWIFVQNNKKEEKEKSAGKQMHVPDLISF